MFDRTQQIGPTGGTPLAEPTGSAWMSDEAILAVCDAAGFTKRQMAELTTVRWIDGIDIQVPTFPLKRFVQMLLEPNKQPRRSEVRNAPKSKCATVSLEQALRRYRKRVRKEIEDVRELRSAARRLLNTFQRKVKIPFRFCSYAGEYWFAHRKTGVSIFDDLWSEAEVLALYSKSDLKDGVGKLVAGYPELVTLAKVVCDFDQEPGCPELGELIPTVQPRRSEVRNAD